MKSRAFIGLDQGTRSTKCLLVGESGEILEVAKSSVSLQHLNSVSVEQDPLELLNSTEQVLTQVLKFCEMHRIDVLGIGLASQRSGVCAWNSRTGDVLHPLITWADTRFQPQIDALGVEAHYVAERALIPVLPNYAAPKFAYLQQLFPNQAIYIGTLDAYLMWHLDQSHPFIVDDTMAARTMLYDVFNRCWSSELCQIFAVCKSRLPKIVPSLGRSGVYKQIPIFARMGDQQAALYALRRKGIDGVLNLGSIASLSLSTGSSIRPQPGFPVSILFSQANGEVVSFEYLIEAISNTCGQIIDDLVLHGKISELAEIDRHCHYSVERGAPGMIFSAIGGSGSPHWWHDYSSTKEEPKEMNDCDYVRASIENIAGFIIYQIEILKESALLPAQSHFLVSGGLAQSDYLLQFLQACLGDSLFLAATSESTAYGAAMAGYDGWRGDTGTSWSKQPGTPLELKNLPGARERYVKWRAFFKQKLSKQNVRDCDR